MERERPEYLPPIEKPRWGFPWLTVIGISVLALAVFGVKQHLATQAAWNQRFQERQPSTTQAPSARLTPAQWAQRQREDAEIIRQFRERQAMAEQQSPLTLPKPMTEQEFKQRNHTEANGLRCINGILFRRLPNGWENIPGSRC